MGVGGIVEPARSLRSKRHDPAFRKISMSISPSLHHTTDINISSHQSTRNNPCFTSIDVSMPQS